MEKLIPQKRTSERARRGKKEAPVHRLKHWLFQSVEPCERRLSKKPIGVRFEDDVDEKLRGMGAASQGLIRRYVRRCLVEEGYLEEGSSLSDGEDKPERALRRG